jgi:hypothetical protein
MGFDDYFFANNLPDPVFVKMNIEGMETLALKKMTHIIRNVKPVFQIELHNSPEFRNLGYADYPGFLRVSEGGFDFNETGWLIDSSNHYM